MLRQFKREQSYIVLPCKMHCYSPTQLCNEAFFCLYMFFAIWQRSDIRISVLLKSAKFPVHPTKGITYLSKVVSIGHRMLAKKHISEPEEITWIFFQKISCTKSLFSKYFQGLFLDWKTLILRTCGNTWKWAFVSYWKQHTANIFELFELLDRWYGMDI